MQSVFTVCVRYFLINSIKVLGKWNYPEGFESTYDQKCQNKKKTKNWQLVSESYQNGSPGLVEIYHKCVFY